MPIRFNASHWPPCRYRVRYAEASESIFKVPGWRAHRHRYWVVDVGPLKAGMMRVHKTVHRRNQQSVGLYAPGVLYEENLEVGQLVSWTWLLVEEEGPSRLRALTGEKGFVFLNDPQRSVYRTIHSLVAMMRSKSEGRPFHLNAFLHQILGTLFDLHGKYPPPPPEPGAGRLHPWRKAVRDWLELHPAQLRSGEIAKMLNVSLSTLTHQYRPSCGETLGQTIADWRREKARVLLTRVDLSIKEISSQLGFGHQSHFTNFFRATTGLTPREYRKMIKG